MSRPLSLSALRGTLTSPSLLASARLSSGFGFSSFYLYRLTAVPLATTCSFQIEFNQDQILGKSSLLFMLEAARCLWIKSALTCPTRFVLHLEQQGSTHQPTSTLCCSVYVVMH